MVYDRNMKADFLFFLFTQGGANDGSLDARIVRNITPDQIPKVVEELTEVSYHGGDYYFDVQGCVQLAREQTHFTDTSILAPKEFMVYLSDDYYFFLHECKQYVPTFLGVDKMEQEANTSLEDQLDQERADGEGMYPDDGAGEA